MMGIEDTQQFDVDRTQEFRRTTAVKQTRRAAVLVLGGALVVLGVILIPLPGPGLAVVFLGLTVLSWEFPAAKRLLYKIKSRIKQVRDAHKASGKNR